MKVNIKGLVFTGFAAAILSANAMAAGENIVTSKSYVDAKIASGTAANSLSESTTIAPNQTQVINALATKQSLQADDVYQVSKNGTWENANSAVSVTPTSGTAYLTKTDNQNGSVTLNVNAMTDSGFSHVDDTQTEGGTADANKLPTAAAVKGYVDSAIEAVSGADGLAGKQDITDDDSGFVVGDSEGEWAPVSSAVLDGTYTTQAVNNSTGAVTIDVDATTDTALTESAKIPTAGTVKTYVDAKVVNNVTDTSTGIAPSVGAVNSALATKENLSNKLTGTGSSTIDSHSADSTSYPSAAAVYNYVQSQTGGTIIPAMGDICSTKPCALVNDSTGLHWRTMATASDNGGACGDLDTTCGVSSNPVETGSGQ